MGSVGRDDEHASRRVARRLAGVVLPALGIFLLLALTADVLLAFRGSDADLDKGPAPADGDNVARALLLGDSLMTEAGPEITQLLEGKYTETRIEGGPGTGPLTPQGFWRGELQRGVDEFNPDVVVIEACCNYDPADPYRLYGGAAVEADSDEMYEQWELAMRELVTIAGARGAQVFVVTVPDPDPEGPYRSLGPRITRLNEMYQRLGVDLVDWRREFQPEGAYAAVIRVGGTPRTVRAADGLHFTGDGDLLAAAVTWGAVQAALSPDDPASAAG
jgi:hypothetical protein